MTPPSFTRRGLWRLALALAGSVATLRTPQAAPLDQGIGGTGVAPESEQQDRGIGGTGVVGTIRRFGSIYVNDLRIAYPQNAVVRIDGQPAAVSDLRIGQVVQVVAQSTDGFYSTRAIEVSSEAAGPISSVSSRSLEVLGQTVSLASLAASGCQWKAGDFVAVYGLRQTDGTIVASLISPRARGPQRVAGPVRRGPGGVPMIGGLALPGLDPSLVGQRALVNGRLVGGAFAVASQESETAILQRAGVRTYLIEAYVERRDGGVQLGSGLRLFGGAPYAPATGALRAIVHANLGPSGLFTVQSLRPAPVGFFGSRPGGPNGPGNRFGPRGPGGFRSTPRPRFGGPFRQRPAPIRRNRGPYGGGPFVGPGGPGRSPFGGPGGPGGRRRF